MPREQVEFEFPDPDKNEVVEEIEIEPSSAQELGAEPVTEEVEVKESKKSEEEEEIEVVDDTPPADRGRKKSDPPEDVTDEELNEYSEKVAKRIKHFSKGYHDERREKERAMRESQEALTYAQQLLNENKALRANMGRDRATMYKQAAQTVDSQLKSARKELADAHEAGNTEGVVAAQEKLAQATLRVDKLKQIKVPLQRQQTQVQEQVRDNQMSAPAPRVDERAQKWAEDNSWFGTDDEMTSFALGFHNKITSDGVDPTSDEYYEKVNSRMREVFPERFEDISTKDEERGKKPSAEVVAPTTRSNAPKKVKLTKTQVALAKKLGVPISEYAKQVAMGMEK
jgi:hypothetical protein